MTGAIAVMSSYGGGPPGPTPFDFYNPPQLVSASFDGTTQSLQATNAAFTFAGDFTVEAWFRPTNVTGTHYLFTLGGASAGKYAVFLVGTSVTTNLLSSSSVTYTSTVSINAWSHIAVVRSGSTVSVYINGVASATTDTQTGTIGNGSLRIGADQPAANRFAGYISNFRVDPSAVYTANFTVPTRPLSTTGAAFFASLGATAFVDYSTNAIAITNTGTVPLVDSSPFAATWTDSVSGIIATVAVRPNSSSTSNPTYDARYGGGLNIAQTAQTYVDVPTTYGGLGAYTISMAANIPAGQGSHYVGVYDGNTVDRAGAYINARVWVGDGFEVGTQSSWGASFSPTMATLSWWDFVYNGRFVSAYRNGTVFINNYDLGVGNQNTGWLNPLRFVGDESVSSNNTMWPGTVYRIKCQNGALSSGAITTQYNAVRATYGL